MLQNAPDSNIEENIKTENNPVPAPQKTKRRWRLKLFLITSLIMLGAGIYIGMEWKQYRHISDCLELGGSLQAETSDVCIVNR